MVHRGLWHARSAEAKALLGVFGLAARNQTTMEISCGDILKRSGDLAMSVGT
jgi:hypothetical protein